MKQIMIDFGSDHAWQMDGFFGNGTGWGAEEEHPSSSSATDHMGTGWETEPNHHHHRSFSSASQTSHVSSLADVTYTKVRCAFFDRTLHSRMSLNPTPARLKRTCMWTMAFLSGVHSSYRLALEIASKH
jgi:hypothetical protein